MRRIAIGEPCLTASEIVKRFFEATGHDLHPTNAGQAAKKLGLDFVIRDVEIPGLAFPKKQKFYSELDLPAIFKQLQALADRRGKHK